MKAAARRGLPDAALAWFFVVVWGSGFVATKAGLHHAAPFTFLALRFAFGLACLVLLAALVKPRWPRGARQVAHVAVAGALMHAGNLGGSHYAQYLGLSAGIVALLLATQPLLTALVQSAGAAERLDALQWTGIALGLAGVAMVVGRKIDLGGATAGAFVAVVVSLVSITTGTLYQRRWCADVDLWAAGAIQFAVALVLFAPAAAVVEGFVVDWAWPLFAAIAFLVIGGSILAVNALHTLMRHGTATRVTSLVYLTPVVAVALEWLAFGVAPGWLAAAGIAITCAGVALVTRERRTAVAETET